LKKLSLHSSRSEEENTPQLRRHIGPIYCTKSEITTSFIGRFEGGGGGGFDWRGATRDSVEILSLAVAGVGR